MCPIIIGLLVLLLYYAGAQLESAVLLEQIGQQQVEVARGWELLVALWPLSLFLFLLGVLVVLLFFRVRSMLNERRQKVD